MPTIKCHNTRNDRGAIRKCDRFFMQLPKSCIDALKANPGEAIITRCPTCPQYQRWNKMYYDKTFGMTCETIDKPKTFDEEIKFDRIISSEQVG